MTTTSASCCSAIPRATVAPTFPAPPTTVTLRFISVRLLWLLALGLGALGCKAKPRASQRSARALHALDHGVGKLRRLQLRGALHEAREIVGDSLDGYGAVHPFHDQIGRLHPSQMPEHHLAGEDHRPWVHLVLIR